MESHAKLVQFIVEHEDWKLLTSELTDEQRDCVDAIELKNGVESWADRLIEMTGQSWEQVYGGKAGLVELAVFRNALMHGYTRVSSYLVEKARKRGGGMFPINQGSPLAMDFALLHEYRGRIRSFCRILGDGVVHRARDTHIPRNHA